MTDPEEEGGKGNYLRVRVQVNISKPLSWVRKIWSKGKVIGWVALRYERLPNFCYWCGLVSHDDRDCETWLRSKGSLQKKDQHFGEWIRAEVVLSTRKSSITVLGFKPKYHRSAPPQKQTPQTCMPMPTDLQTTVFDEEANKTTVSDRSVTAGTINGNNYKESLQANH